VLTDPGQSAAWWAHGNISDWRPGSVWEHRRLDSSAADVAGTVLAASSKNGNNKEAWTF
jgi:hypothetical protein